MRIYLAVNSTAPVPGGYFCLPVTLPEGSHSHIQKLVFLLSEAPEYLKIWKAWQCTTHPAGLCPSASIAGVYIIQYVTVMPPVMETNCFRHAEVHCTSGYVTRENDLDSQKVQGSHLLCMMNPVGVI